MKLKSKILLGYSLSLALVLLVGAWGITNLRRLGKASEAILEENYNSILAAENTIDALERQDSAILLYLLESRDRGSQQFRQNQIEFLKWLGRAESNITIPGEAEIVAQIEESYQDYLTVFFELQQRGNLTTEDYYQTILPIFEEIRDNCVRLRIINQETMEAASENAGEISQQATWSMAIAKYPQIRIVLISAHGTVDNAVEAMKLGAVDFLQKPFTPKELRNLVYNVLEAESSDDETEYQSTLKSAKKLARKRQFDKALSQAKKAIGLDPSNPEALDFLGQIQETLKDFENARKSYRAAISLDPTYQSAKDNLDRATSNFSNRPTL